MEVEVSLDVLTPDELKPADHRLCMVHFQGSCVCTKAAKHIGPHVAHVGGAPIFAWIRVGDFALDDIITDLQRIREDTA